MLRKVPAQKAKGPGFNNSTDWPIPSVEAKAMSEPANGSLPLAGSNPQPCWDIKAEIGANDTAVSGDNAAYVCCRNGARL